MTTPQFRHLHAKFLELFAVDADELQRAHGASDEIMSVVTVYAAIQLASLSMKTVGTRGDNKAEFLSICAEIYGEQVQ